MFHEILTRLNFEIKHRIFRYSRVSMPSLWKYIYLWEFKKLLSHAAQNTEYWQTTLSSSNIKPDDLTDLNILGTLPPLTRATIKKGGLSMFLANNIQENRRLPAHTSGSTGEPLVFYQDTKELLKRRLNILYGLSLHNIQLTRPALISGLDTHVYLDPLGVKFSNLGEKKSRTSILYPMLEQLQPEVLFCTPSYLQMFNAFLQQDGKKTSFKMIYCAGESMSQKNRRIFSSTFNSFISTWYGTRETGPIAVECTAGEYHILPWSSYIEIVNSDNTALSTGKEGDIIVTSFSNYVMPFIRYKTGDRGIILPHPCKCGNVIPVLKLSGRAPTIVNTPNGKSFAISELGTAVASQFAAAILQFQILEKKSGEYTFRFIPNGQYTQNLNTPLLKLLHEIIGEKPGIILERAQEILPDTSGKTHIFLKLH